ncbi:DUF5686 and carboxypeptidase regulatory-like domain-containing protein [Sediminibacterium sp.]|uniref:DUF5686 and carboxypeptidase regulatory-like domain-containing protein n=1 Tax=Sediminibacterium sp. TaxID=1917865 RepID=UPI0025D7F2F2|nr:DUF5686 and carboxypeptidase regulatory-like domain-containing protein [Sediminibacterium sp.]MBW0178037.1 DUF5686 and carboxypeptidase regulatory-like domain-containing protein [Sediminibacterium sp.]
MKPLLLTTLLSILSYTGYTQTISGTITDSKNEVLPFSSVVVKGTTQGASANSKGFYSIQLQPGIYTLVCQYIGYKSEEKKVTVEKGKNSAIDFQLEPQQYSLQDVTVNTKGEDPAYEIIRKTISKRTQHLKEIKKFSADVYLKGQMQLRDYPNRFFGQKVDFEDGDSSKRKMLFLSETIAKYSVEEPNKEKIEVLSTKVSGRSNAFGFSSPQIISFYNNTIQVGEDLNPRGFISPIASGALSFYRYKFEGTFYENGVEISRIKVIPRRKYEPLFQGYINIIENEWRIHSLRLNLVREQQMQFLDTLVVEQLYVPTGNLWVIKNQVIYPSGKIFGFDFFGSFVQVYDRFNLNPTFEKKYFNNTIIKVYDSANKKTMAYWDSIRPLPLLKEEVLDYKKKDSLEQVRKDPKYMDSIDRKRNKLSLAGILLGGQSISIQKKKVFINFDPLINTFNYNTVEGGVLHFSPTWSKRFDETSRRSLQITPYFRYGFANKHFNTHITGRYNFGKKYFNSISIAGGRRVFQYNNADPITARINTYTTLLYENNHLKMYEANFLRLNYSAGIGNGLTFAAGFHFQDRFGLNNLADPVSWKNIAGRSFTPNYPVDLTNTVMPRNQSATFTAGFTWRPGGKYIELPDRKIGIGSDFPTFNFSVTHAVKGLLGSDADFTKWRIAVSDDLDLKLGGKLSYRGSIGGFLSAKQVYIPDYTHFQGNQTVLANDPLSGFQLAPYYRYSNTSKFYATANVEYHLNGLLSNKIPGFRRLNWFFVTGANMLYTQKGKNYYETFFGVENILKFMRIDFVQGFETKGPSPRGVRLTIPLFTDSRGND